MKLVCIHHHFEYQMENICRLFFPFEKIGVNAEGREVITAVQQDGQGTTLRACFEGESRQCVIANDSPDWQKQCELRLAALLFDILCDKTGVRPQWGILTGIRPGKLMRQKIAQLGDEGAKAFFRDTMKCTERKIDLCYEAVRHEDDIIAQSRPHDFSLYFSVPFCPTRCSYCSFVSHSVEKSMELVEPYVDCLCRELEVTGELAQRLGLRLSTVYFGGGTPTVLSAQQLQRVMHTVQSSFDLSSSLEYNVEAGRPDTITEEKLAVIRSAGATRISINPQSLCDEVLRAIGRRHTAQQVLDAFALARRCGFDNINMDLIAGLPEDTAARFADTLRGVLALDPESITVHALSMKRSSELTVQQQIPSAVQGSEAAAMLDAVQEMLPAAYRPYYLYRQSKTVGNLENTGYAKAGKEGRYNIYIMDETHTILACGASATTKLKGSGGEIERIYNYKYPYEYISRFGEMLKRKEGIVRFHQQYGL